MYISIEDYQKIVRKITRLEDDILAMKKLLLEASVRGDDPLLVTKALAKMDLRDEITCKE